MNFEQCAVSGGWLLKISIMLRLHFLFVKYSSALVTDRLCL